MTAGRESTLEQRLPALSPRHRIALLEAWDWIDATLTPQGVLVTGSIVRGEGRAGSNLDLVVLWRRPGRRRMQRWFAGVPAEVFANSAAWLAHSIAAEARNGRPVMAHMLATGVVLRDDDGVLANVVADAARLLRTGLRMTARELERRRYLAACAVEDTLDLLPADGGDARLLGSRAVDAMLEYAFLARGQFQPRAKVRLAALRELDPGAADSLLAVLDASDPAARAQRLREAGERILGASGFFAWDSDDEPAEPPHR
jgi:hypothetical protein